MCDRISDFLQVLLTKAAEYGGKENFHLGNVHMEYVQVPVPQQQFGTPCCFLAIKNMEIIINYDFEIAESGISYSVTQNAVAKYIKKQFVTFKKIILIP